MNISGRLAPLTPLASTFGSVDSVRSGGRYPGFSNYSGGGGGYGGMEQMNGQGMDPRMMALMQMMRQFYPTAQMANGGYAGGGFLGSSADPFGLGL